MLVVFDTNVLVSALKSSNGASFQLLRLVLSEQIQPALSAPLMFEYDDVTSRVGLLPHFQPAEIQDFLDWFTSISSLHKVHFLWRPLLKDPKDDMVLECAVSARAHYIVTHNLSDFLKAESLGVRVVTPSKLVEILTNHQS